MSDCGYPLLHQQPLFTEGHFAQIAGLEGRADLPIYRPDALPRTEAAGKEFIRLSAFPAAPRVLMDQYAEAFDKVGFTRLTSGFSKKRVNHAAAVALHFAHYNLVRIHKTLKMTPAMAHGITNHLWSMTELLEASGC